MVTAIASLGICKYICVGVPNLKLAKYLII
jgi:hypothetical protein